MSLYISWQSGSQIVKGPLDLEGVMSFEVTTPGTLTEPITLVFYTDGDIPVSNLINIKLYLNGDPTSLDILTNQWPYIQLDRPDLNGGLEISTDQGRTFTRFNQTYGYLSNPTTWITLPATATAYSTEDGVLSSIDTGTIQLRLVIPPGATQFMKFNFNIEVDCDVR